MNPTICCRRSAFEEDFKFQYVRRDIHIHIATQNIILTFLSKWHFACSVNMEVSPNIWNRNTFQTTNLCALWVHRQFQRRKLYNWIYFTVKLKLNSSFNGFELYVKLEIFRSSYFGSKSWFCYSAYRGINLRLRGKNLCILLSPTIKLKLEMWEIGFIVFLNVHEKINFKN